MESDLVPPTHTPLLAERLPAERAELLGYARRLAASAAFPLDPEDLVQDVMERALRYAHAFDLSQALQPWLRRTALRVLLDRRASWQRDPVRTTGEPRDPVSDVRDVLAEREHVARLLAPLTSVERAVLVGFHAEGRSQAELAETLGLPTGTIKSHLHRARRKLLEIRDGGRDDGR